MCSTDTQPLRSLEELWEWKKDSVHKQLIGKPLANYTRRENHPETLICHDMKGGYLSEESVKGCPVSQSFHPYVMLHWWYMDVFAYFSHELITIPPVGWIDQAHKHGVIVLGTLITEWETGADICSEILSSEENVERTVVKMVEIAVKYNFEGWLINIENEIEESKIGMMAKFLSSLTERMHTAIGEQSRVIWYDAVTVQGKLQWQNSLTDLNERWFSCTDGIFLNYTWVPKQLAESGQRAGARRHRVYVGVDCFGRGCYGGGGWNCNEAFSHIRSNDLSVALFAPAWIVETLPSCDTIQNSLRFWDRLNAYVHARPITSLPIETDFSFGFHQNNDKCKCYNLSNVALQPHYLSSGAFPCVSDNSLVFPGRASYKLFETDMVLDGDVTVSVNAEMALQLLVWKEGSERDLPTVVEKDTGMTNIWNVHFDKQRIHAVGFASNGVVILHSFTMHKTDNKEDINCKQ